MIDTKGIHTKTHNYYTFENEGQRKESWKQPGDGELYQQGKSIQIIADSSSETMEIRTKCQKFFHMLKIELSTRILCLVKIIL